jgi:hypothetical protein
MAHRRGCLCDHCRHLKGVAGETTYLIWIFISKDLEWNNSASAISRSMRVLGNGLDSLATQQGSRCRAVDLDHSRSRIEPSDATADWSDGATDGGSHDPSTVEPPVGAIKKSIPGKTPKEAVSEKSGSRRATSGLEDCYKGSSER